MTNPKTTILGYVTLAGSVLYLAAHLLGGSLSMTDLNAVMTALGGVGLIAAQDGKH